MNKRTYQVVGQRVLVRPDDPEKKTEWGLVLPASWDEKRERQALDCGTVLAIGSLAWKDFKDDTPWCKIGDRVVFARHSGKFMVDPEDDKKEVVLIKDEDVQCVIVGE